MDIPSTPGLPALVTTRRNACQRLTRSQTSSINCRVSAGLSVSRFATDDSDPSAAAIGASLLLSVAKASQSWLFCRSAPMSRVSYAPCHLLVPADEDRSGLPGCHGPGGHWLFLSFRTSVSHRRSDAGTTPSADFCDAVSMPCGMLSHESTARRRPPEVSLTVFTACPPDLQPWPLMELDFAICCSLVRPGLPQIRFLYVGPRLCSMLPSDDASRRRPCTSLNLHLHQAG